MDETTIYTPDSNINITDNTVEHIIHNTRTIKIDRSKLLELYEKIAKLELPFYYKYKYRKTRPISDGFRKNNVNYWAFREIRSIIPHL